MTGIDMFDPLANIIHRPRRGAARARWHDTRLKYRQKQQLQIVTKIEADCTEDATPAQMPVTVDRSGSAQSRPGKRAKSRSNVIHVQPLSIASAARYASGTSFALAFPLRQSRVNSAKWFGPGRTWTQFSKFQIASICANAWSSGVGDLNIFWLVTNRTKPDKTNSLIANDPGPASSFSNQARTNSCRGASAR
jgi:hypothetical protein